MQRFHQRITLIGVAAIVGSPAMAMDIEEFSIHGFASQGYALSTDNNWLPGSTDGTFEFNEVGLNVGMQLSDQLRVGLQLFSRDFGDLGNNQIELDYAYGDYSHSDWLGIRIGRIKTPIGLYNEYLDLDLARTFVLYPQAIYQPNFRDVQVAYNGIGLYGYLDAGPAGSVEYDLYAGDLRLDPDESIGKEFDTPGFFGVDDIDIKYTTGARLIWNTPLDGLRAAGSLFWFDDMVVSGTFGSGAGAIAGAPGRYDIDNFYQYIFSLDYTWEDWVFSGEYSRSKGDILVFADLPPAFGGTMEVGSDSVNWEGWFVTVTRRIDEHWELGAYYSEFYEDAGDRSGDDFSTDHRAYNKTLAFAARYDVNEYWTLKGEVQHHTGTAQLESRYQDEDWEEDWQLFLLKTTFNF